MPLRSKPASNTWLLFFFLPLLAMALYSTYAAGRVWWEHYALKSSPVTVVGTIERFWALETEMDHHTVCYVAYSYDGGGEIHHNEVQVEPGLYTDIVNEGVGAGIPVVYSANNPDISALREHGYSLDDALTATIGTLILYLMVGTMFYHHRRELSYALRETRVAAGAELEPEAEVPELKPVAGSKPKPRPEPDPLPEGDGGA